MAYSFADPASLPLPADAVAPSAQSTRLMQAIAGSQCSAHAKNVIRPIGQAWPDGQCNLAGAATTVVGVCRVPLVSDAHTTLFFDVTGQNAGGAGGTVRFISTAASLTFTFNGAVGTPTRLTGSLTMPSSGIYDDIGIELAATAGNTVQLDRVNAEYTPLTSPLAAGRVNLDHTSLDFDPMGTTAIAANQALGSWLGRTALDNASGLIVRPRSVTCWTGLTGVTPATGSSTHGPYSHSTPVLVRRGGLEAGVRVTIHVRVSNTGGSDTYVRISAQPARRWPQSVSSAPTEDILTYTAGSGTQWKNTTIALPETLGLAGGVHGCVFGVTLDPSVSPGALSDASILGISAWGE